MKVHKSSFIGIFLLCFVSNYCFAQNEFSTGVVVNYKKISHGEIEI